MNTRIMKAIAITAAVTLISCDKPPSPPPTPQPSATAPVGANAVPPATEPAPAADTAPNTVAVAGIVFDVPVGWRSVQPANQMRLAEVRVPDSAGDASRDCLLTVSTAGGDVAMNIDRWARQMLSPAGEPPIPDVRVVDSNGLKIHVVELEGAYQGMTDPAPLPEWMMRGAIVEGAGSATVFIKMTGPAASMRSVSDGWAALVSGIRKP